MYGLRTYFIKKNFLKDGSRAVFIYSPTMNTQHLTEKTCHIKDNSLYRYGMKQGLQRKSDVFNA